MNRASWIFIVTACLGAAASATGCNSLKPVSVPFHVYNSSLLNGGAEAALALNPHWAPVRVVDENRALAQNISQEPADETAPTPKVVAATNAPATVSTSTQHDERIGAEFVRAVYEANGVRLAAIGRGEGAVANLHAQVKAQGGAYLATRPAVGDVVFFHNTYDRNGDGRNNDWYTRAGLVESVDKDGTIHVIYHSDGEARSLSMNLEQPGIAKDARTGKVWNSQVRSKGADDAPFTQYLGGELFAGFGNLLGDKEQFVILDNWTGSQVYTARQ